MHIARSVAVFFKV